MRGRCWCWPAPVRARRECSRTGSPTWSRPALRSPGEILAITFTNKAADEMRERVESLVGRISRLMWVMTFHSACARILRREAERLGYKRAFTIYDQADSLRMVKRCMDELEVDPKRFPPRCDPVADLGRKEPPARRRGLPRGDQGVLRGHRRRRLHALREADARGERDGLRRPPRPHRQPLRALRGRPPTATSRPSDGSSSTSTRTPTAPSTGCCSYSPRSTGT